MKSYRGTSVTDYGTALNIKDWNGTSGTNVTGTCPTLLLLMNRKI